MRRAIILIGLASVMAAQQPSTFRVNTRLVEVDVVVRSKDRAVTGLTKNDFRILDNGKPQSIATFSIRVGAATKGKARPPTTCSGRRRMWTPGRPAAIT